MRTELAVGGEPAVDLEHHGDAELAPGLVDLAVNVRSPGPPPWLRERLAAALDSLGSYPDPRAARAAIAARHRRDPAEVLVTAGAAEAFVLVARAVPARHAVVVHPSFTEPEAALRRAAAPAARISRLLLPPPFTLDPTAVPDDADLVVLGNPTNPTGVLHPAATLRALVRPGRVLVVDEAFADTVAGERESLAGEALPGLVVVRSLTKTWGLAGLRVGYLLAARQLVARLATSQPRWSVSTLGLVAALACSEPAALAQADADLARLAAARADLAARLARLPQLAVSPGESAAFVLVRAERGAELRRALRRRGFAVRRGDTFPGLGPDWLRIAVRDPGTSAALAAAISAAYAELSCLCYPS